MLSTLYLIPVFDSCGVDVYGDGAIGGLVLTYVQSIDGISDAHMIKRKRITNLMEGTILHENAQYSKCREVPSPAEWEAGPHHITHQL
jgi:hypothetical protein